MLSLRCTSSLRSHVWPFYVKNLRFQTQHAVMQNEEYTEKPEYPSIKDLSFKARKEMSFEDWCEAIRAVPTVEEKLIKINMPRYYGYQVFQLSDEILPYNFLPVIQHYTRTIFEPLKSKESEGSEKLIEGDKEKKHIDSLVDSVKGDVQEALEFSHEYYKYNNNDGKGLKPQERERELTQLIVEQVHRTISNALIADCYHLHEAEVDFNPRHEAFWSVGGIEPPKNVVKSIEGRKWETHMAKEPVNRFMQYKSSPYLALRHRHQLPPWKSEQEYTNLELAKEIPRFNYDPRTLGILKEYQHVTNIPGYWPGSSNNFGLLSYQPRSYMHHRPANYGEEDRKASLHCQAIQTSYAWLMAQASYNGFNTFNEITYPMNTQTIITDGRNWSFYEYQLNTLLVHSHFVDTNPRVNFCRGTDELQLFQAVDEKGKCIGFNPEVLRHLVQFYANTPSVQRPLSELQPYLNPEVKRIANYDNADKRESLEKLYKRLVSNRPRHLALPEIYLWEKIYKIDYNTRPLEPKRRFFELHINPWKRTLDQHQKEYIPKVLRPEGPKSRKKFKPTYYP